MGNVYCSGPEIQSDIEHHDEEKQDKPEQKEDIKPQIKDDFKVICAIDFGTDGVGLAYSIPTKDTYRMCLNANINEVNDENEEKEQKQYYKALEANQNIEIKVNKVYEHRWCEEENYAKKKAFILLDKRNELFMFGKQAVNTYENLVNNTGFKLFERFKMNLFRDPRWKKDVDSVYYNSLSDIPNNDTQPLLNNNDVDRTRSYSKQNKVNLCKQMPHRGNETYCTEHVFIETLKYFKSEAIKYIQSNINHLNDITCDDIQWILTIPGIWSDKAKCDMKQWGIKAGLINPLICNQLRMALEPECAALDVQYLIHTKQYNQLRILSKPSHSGKIDAKKHGDILLRSGDKYILIDAGGGTVDIVSHAVECKFGVREVVKVKGGAYASSQIDLAIMQVLNQLFDEDKMALFKTQQHQMWVRLLENCAVAKDSFQEVADEKWHSILLPQPFVNFMEKRHKTHNVGLVEKLSKIKEVYNCYCYCGEPLVELRSDWLYLSITVWKKIFDSCVQKIIEDCNYILENEAMKDGQCKYIFMVGGLSQNYYFQDEVVEAFGMDSEYKIIIIVPVNGILSVVCGAARFGIIPNFVQSRILQRTYCIEGSILKKDINKSMHLSKQFIVRHTLTTKGNIKMVRGILGKGQCLCIKGEEILMNHIWRIKEYRKSADIKQVDIVIYCGKDNVEIPETVQDAMKLGEFKIIFPETSVELCMMIEFSFYDTILTVYAYPINSPELRKYCSIVYDSSDVE